MSRLGVPKGLVVRFKSARTSGKKTIFLMNNKNFVNVVPLSSEDAGNNEGTSFGGSECVCVEDGFKVTEAVRVERRATC